MESLAAVHTKHRYKFIIKIQGYNHYYRIVESINKQVTETKKRNQENVIEHQSINN